jgi:hypothetical protein
LKKLNHKKQTIPVTAGEDLTQQTIPKSTSSVLAEEADNKLEA